MEINLNSWEIIHSSQVNQQLPALKGETLSNPLEEGFFVFKERGVVSLHAKNQSSFIYGARQSLIALLSEEFRNFFGEFTPKYSLRPLFPQGNRFCKISSHLFLSLPSWLFNEELPIYMKRLFSLGYNALVIGSLDIPEDDEEVSKENVLHVLKNLYANNLKIILAPNTRNFLDGAQKRDNIKELEVFFPFCDFFFWQSQHLDEKFEDEFKTHQELIVEEVNELEKILKDKAELIFYLPFKEEGKNVQWLETLIDANHQAIIALSSHEGSPYDSHLSLNPIFSSLRKSYFPSKCKLLPLINGGLQEKGEALWPNLNLQALIAVKEQIPKDQCIGFATLTNQLPEETSLLDCSLWMHGAFQWTGIEPKLLLHAWLKAFRPHWPTYDTVYMIQEAEWIVQEIFKLKQIKNHKEISLEKQRQHIDLIVMRIQALSILSQKEASLHALFRYFLLDAKRILVHFAGNINVSLPNLITSEDPPESFWTSTSHQNPLRKRPYFLVGDTYLSSVASSHFLTK